MPYQPAHQHVQDGTSSLDLDDAGAQARFLIRDRDGKYPDLFDAILTDAGIEVVLSGIRMPRMNSIMERWVQTCRNELLDRTLIWNLWGLSIRVGALTGVDARQRIRDDHGSCRLGYRI